VVGKRAALELALIGALLAVFSIRYLVNQVVVGVVINLLVLGLTGYLYRSLMQQDAQTYNSPATLAPIRIPGLADIPVLGPLLFLSLYDASPRNVFIAMAAIGVPFAAGFVALLLLLLK